MYDKSNTSLVQNATLQDLSDRGTSHSVKTKFGGKCSFDPVTDGHLPLMTTQFSMALCERTVGHQRRQ